MQWLHRATMLNEIHNIKAKLNSVALNLLTTASIHYRNNMVFIREIYRYYR